MKIVQYEKIVMLLLLGSLSLQVYAMDDNDDDINPKRNQIQTFKSDDEDLKRKIIEYKLNEMDAENQQHVLNYLFPGGSKTVADLKSYIASLRFQELTALYVKIGKLEDQRAQAVCQPVTQQIGPQERMPNLFGSGIVFGKEQKNKPTEEDKRDAELLKRLESLSVPSYKPNTSMSPSNPYAPCGNPRDLLIYNQAMALQRQFDREDESVWQHLGRAEVKVALAVTLGAPIFELLVKNYGPSALGFIEEKLGFGPSDQEKAAMMQNAMMQQMLKYRLAQAEVDKKGLEVSILRAVQTKHLLDAEKEELQLDVVKKNKEHLDDITELTREKKRLAEKGLKFPASKEKELNELKYLYKENQMIYQQLQDLKSPASTGMIIPGVA